MDANRYLVSSATSQIGGRIARGLAAAGAELMLSGRTTASSTSWRLTSARPPLAADLRSPDAPELIAEEAVTRLRGLDGLVNAAGVVAVGQAAELDDATLDGLVAVNLIAPIRLTGRPRSTCGTA